LDIPIIAISASVSAENQVQSWEVDIDAFLLKPVDWPSLAALLEKHLALEWEYETASLRACEAMEVAEMEHLLPPPENEMAILDDLALRGDMRGIRERAAYVETLREQFVPIATRLRELAQGFDEREIITLLEHFGER
jgi:hypothetical protein